jgi:hypothetical protein
MCPQMQVSVQVLGHGQQNIAFQRQIVRTKLTAWNLLCNKLATVHLNVEKYVTVVTVHTFGTFGYR